jgi:hypothetical protein
MIKSGVKSGSKEPDAQLGRHIATYYPAEQSSKMNIGAALTAIIVGVAAIAWAFIGAQSLAPVCGGMGLLIAGLGIWGLFTTLQQKKMYVTVYRDGLKYRQGDTSALVRWDEIAAFYCDTPEHYASQRFSQRGGNEVLHYCKIRTVDNQIVRFDDTLKGVRHLADTIQAETVTMISPYVMAAFEAGTPVDFGPLIVSKEGLRAKDTFMPWREVVRFDLLPKQGVIVIEQTNNPVRWGTFMIAYVPNLTSLKVIVRQMLAAHTNGAVVLRTSGS